MKSNRLNTAIRFNALIIIIVLLFTACSKAKPQTVTADNFSFTFSPEYSLLHTKDDPKPKDMNDDVFVTALKRLESDLVKSVAVPKTEDYIIVLQIQKDESFKLYESLKLFKESELIRLAGTISALYEDIGYKMQEPTITNTLDRNFFHIRGVSGGTAPLAGLDQYTTIIDENMVTLTLFSIIEGKDVTKEQSDELLAILNTMVHSAPSESSSSSSENGESSSSSK